MKISVSARGESLDSEVDPRFGRTAGFVLFDSESGSAEYLDNSAQQDSAKGTGVKAAQLIAKAGAEALITGQLGPNAAQFLRKFSNNQDGLASTPHLDLLPPFDTHHRLEQFVYPENSKMVRILPWDHTTDCQQL